MFLLFVGSSVLDSKPIAKIGTPEKLKYTFVSFYEARASKMKKKNSKHQKIKKSKSETKNKKQEPKTLKKKKDSSLS